MLQNLLFFILKIILHHVEVQLLHCESVNAIPFTRLLKSSLNKLSNFTVQGQLIMQQYELKLYIILNLFKNLKNKKYYIDFSQFLLIFLLNCIDLSFLVKCILILHHLKLNKAFSQRNDHIYYLFLSLLIHHFHHIYNQVIRGNILKYLNNNVFKLINSLLFWLRLLIHNHSW